MGWRLGTLLFAIFFLLGFIVASIFRYNDKFKTKYKIKSMFPYELNYDSYFLENGFGNFCMIFLTASMIAFFVTFDLSFGKTFYLPIVIVGSISAMVIPFLVLCPLKFLKAHIAIVVTEFCTAICLPGLIGVAALRLYQTYDGGTIAIAIVISSFVVALSVLLVAFSPKISLKIMMDETKNEKGEIVYTRPKCIPLAFTEWLLMFSYIVDMVLVFILMLA